MITALRTVANLLIFAPLRLCVSIFIGGFRITGLRAGRHVLGRAGVPPAVPGILPGTSAIGCACLRNGGRPASGVPGRIPGTAGRIPALPDACQSASACVWLIAEDGIILPMILIHLR